MRRYLTILTIIMIVSFASCKKERLYSYDNSLKLSFSSDTVTFDTVFTTIGSSTRQLMIYNNNDDNLIINSVRLAGGTSSQFSINLDGESGYDFSNVEIYAKDSLFLFVRVTINPNNDNNPFFVEDQLIFETIWLNCDLLKIRFWFIIK